jgi:hypothetical protein
MQLNLPMVSPARATWWAGAHAARVSLADALSGQKFPARTLLALPRMLALKREGTKGRFPAALSIFEFQGFPLLV